MASNGGNLWSRLTTSFGIFSGTIGFGARQHQGDEVPPPVRDPDLISRIAPIASGRGPEDPELWVLSNDPPERTPLLVVDNAPDQAEEAGEALVAPVDLDSQIIPLEEDGS